VTLLSEILFNIACKEVYEVVIEFIVFYKFVIFVLIVAKSVDKLVICDSARF
jgi:hypothetical protein